MRGLISFAQNLYTETVEVICIGEVKKSMYSLPVAKITEFHISDYVAGDHSYSLAEELSRYADANQIDSLLFEHSKTTALLVSLICAGKDAVGMFNVKRINISADVVAAERPALWMMLDAEVSLTKIPPAFTADPDRFEKTTEIGEPIINRIDVELSKEEWIDEESTFTCSFGESLADCDLLLAAGRGVNRTESAGKIQVLSELCGAVVGGSRPAVQNSVVSVSGLIGISGARAKAKTCICFGVSGSSPFMYGVEKCGRLIAVNNDKDALIFKQCDVGIVADCNQLIDELYKLAEERKSHD